MTEVLHLKITCTGAFAGADFSLPARPGSCLLLADDAPIVLRVLAKAGFLPPILLRLDVDAFLLRFESFGP